MVFKDDAAEQLMQGEVDQQKAIDSYTNIDLKSQAPAASAQSPTCVVSIGAKQLRRNEEDGLRTGDVTEDDHGKKFVSDDDEFFEPPSEKKQKTVAMMEAQKEILHDDESYEDYLYYNGNTATMEADEEYKEPSFTYEEASYSDQFEDYTYDTSTMY